MLRALLLLLLLEADEVLCSVYLDDGSFLEKDVPLSELGENVRELKHQRPRESRERRKGSSVGVKFRNFLKESVTMYWDDGTTEGTYSGTVEGLGRTATMSYVGHSFFFKQGREVAARFEILPKKSLYIIEPVDDDVARSEQYLETKREEKFMEEYEEKTGVPWLSFYPRGPPALNMWPAQVVGQTHVVSSSFGYDLSTETPIALKLRVLSHSPQGPRVFHVPGLMSRAECDHVVRHARVKQSMVGQGGGFQSKTRTSSNGWMKRSESETLDHVFRRFGDVLGVDHAKLTPSKNAEELQVVKYTLNQEYAPHHDFGDDGTPNQRFLTLLLYIRVPEKGGATSFPKAFNGKGLQIVPNVGDAVLFYNMLPDGNADDLALHAGMPVTQGEKWVCNLWVWDPKR